MNIRILPCLFALLLPAIAGGAHAGDCDDPTSSEEVAQCLGKDLRDSDATINSSYKELMGRLNEGDKANLRQAQRRWIKDRDAACQLDTKESNRERWYQALLKDYAKTVCVTRYTRQRTNELQAMLVTLSPQQDTTPPQQRPSMPASPAAEKQSEAEYKKGPSTLHSSGKWYFEFAVNYGEVVRIEPCVLSVGVANKTLFTGMLVNIRQKKHADKDVVRYGFAVDLDNGKLYMSRNGVWVDGDPGSNLGYDLKLGREYHAGFTVSADSADPYLERKAIVSNYGDSAMTYTLPAGYSPWRNQTVN
ncbi:lysozyme inhibitor LprI family protein [Accumulibacter sp.]|uniref:lysozyme inhibitor LprI family protein n=1 Tax=Accumulibacter sp. TaxID=2053492 RepID=UPI0028C37796|nr:lysozyme inhibitor LprI family protein [Accumulibacter sp.]